MTLEEYFGDWLRVIDRAELDKVLILLNRMYKVKPICPAQENVFKAFNLCKYHDCKVVFIGQDPYPQKGVATGILFGNSASTREDDWSPSLKIVIAYREEENCSPLERESLSFLKRFPNTQLIPIPDLHAKIYANENEAILSSRNLTNRKEGCSIEVGVVFDNTELIYNNLIKTVERLKEYAKVKGISSTNNEIGFDYLRDNMVVHKEDRVQRKLNFAIIDEVDSVLIDEARTPLIISGGEMKSANLYIDADRFAKSLKDEKDYIYDEKTKSVNLTDAGSEKAEKTFNIKNLYEIENAGLLHYINQALRANYSMKNDVDYVVQDDEVIIVDQFTGRLMKGRAFSDGLHQAIEAKEGVQKPVL